MEPYTCGTPQRQFCRIKEPAAIGGQMLSPDRTILAAKHSDQTIRLWQMTTGRLLHTFASGENSSLRRAVVVRFSWHFPRTANFWLPATRHS
jgi:hypothetical protein